MSRMAAGNTRNPMCSFKAFLIFRSKLAPLLIILCALPSNYAILSKKPRILAHHEQWEKFVQSSGVERLPVDRYRLAVRKSIHRILKLVGHSIGTRLTNGSSIVSEYVLILSKSAVTEPETGVEEGFQTSNPVFHPRATRQFQCHDQTYRSWPSRERDREPCSRRHPMRWFHTDYPTARCRNTDASPYRYRAHHLRPLQPPMRHSRKTNHPVSGPSRSD